MSDRDALDRFKFNLTMALGLFWIALTGGCSAWYLLRVLVTWFNTESDRIDGAVLVVSVSIALGAIGLIPGMLAWHWGKLHAGYDPARDLRSLIWKIPQAVGVTFAVGSWLTGTGLILHSIWQDASCATPPHDCAIHLQGILTVAALTWLPGWLLFWASTRPGAAMNPNPLRDLTAIAFILIGILLLFGIIAWIAMSFGHSSAGTFRPILGLALMIPLVLFALVLIGHGRYLLRKE